MISFLIYHHTNVVGSNFSECVNACFFAMQYKITSGDLTYELMGRYSISIIQLVQSTAYRHETSRLTIEHALLAGQSSIHDDKQANQLPTSPIKCLTACTYLSEEFPLRSCSQILG